MILICPFLSSTDNFSELVKEFLNSSICAPSPLCTVLCSVSALCLPYLTLSWQDFCVPHKSLFTSLLSTRCLLPLFDHPMSIFFLKCFCHLSCFFMQKVGILKLFGYARLLRCYYARRCICQMLIHVWYNDEDQPDGHCSLTVVPGALYPLVFHLPFPSSTLAFSHTSESSDELGNKILKCWTKIVNTKWSYMKL